MAEPPPMTNSIPKINKIKMIGIKKYFFREIINLKISFIVSIGHVSLLIQINDQQKYRNYRYFSKYLINFGKSYI